MEPYKKATQEEIDRRRDFYTGEKRSSLSNTQLWNAMFQEFGVNSLPNVSTQSAQRLSIVFTCLNVLGETIGSLPCDVKRNTKKGRLTEYGMVYRLVHDRPHPNMTAFTFWSAMWKIKYAWGNAYAEIIRDRNAAPLRLEILESREVQPSEDGSYYRYKGRIVAAVDIIHLKNYSMDGYCGISTIRQNALSIGTGLKLKEYNSKIVDERPPGFLTTESKPKDLQAKENIGRMWNNRGGNENTNITAGFETVGGKLIPILYGGVDYKQLSLPADDVAYIESSNLTNTDIYGIFRVPPTFGQNYKDTPYNGAEHQDIVFAKHTLASIRDVEQELTEKLFPESNKTASEPLYIAFNFKGLLRGDTETRQKFYTALFNIGVLNANEIRELEDKPTYEGGDEYYLQGALVPVSKIADFIDSKIQSAKNKGQNKEAVKAEFKKFLRTELKDKLNGSYKTVEEYLQ